MADSNKNDPRARLPLLRKGDKIKQSWINGVTTAINQRRGMSNPPTQRLRPPGGSAGSIIPAVSWCYIDVGDPTNTKNLNAATTLIASDVNNSYDGTVLGKKALINFEKEITLSAVSGCFHAFVFGRGYLSGGAAFSPSAGNSAAVITRLKVTPITASFVTASQTWNNKGSLTLGTAYATQNKVNVSIGVSSNAITGITPAADSGNLFDFCVTAVSDLSFYGLYVECEPVISLGGGTLTSCSATSTITVTTIVAPYIVPATLY